MLRKFTLGLIAASALAFPHLGRGRGAKRASAVGKLFEIVLRSLVNGLGLLRKSPCVYPFIDRLFRSFRIY